MEYGEFKYSDSFHKSLEERKLDHLLGLFQNIALQHKIGMLIDKDLEIVAYHSQRVFGNAEVMKYLDFLHELAKENQLERHPFFEAEELNKKIAKKYNIQKRS